MSLRRPNGRQAKRTGKEVHMTVDATVETARSADGTSIAFERAGTGPPLILVDAALGFAASARSGRWPRSSHRASR
jgi:hypothetical protein